MIPETSKFTSPGGDDCKLRAPEESIHVVDEVSRLNVLSYAAYLRRHDALAWAINQGVGCGDAALNCREPSRGMTPLMFASARGDGEQDAALSDTCSCAELLIRHGANPFLRNFDGDTALHIAIGSRLVNVVRFFTGLVWDFPGLLEARAEPMASLCAADVASGTARPTGQTPLEYALYLGLLDISTLLFDAHVCIQLALRCCVRVWFGGRWLLFMLVCLPACACSACGPGASSGNVTPARAQQVRDLLRRRATGGRACRYVGAWEAGVGCCCV